MKLFPGPSQNTLPADSGGKPKTWAYWLITCDCLGKMLEFSNAIQLLINNNNPATRTARVAKVKNLLTRYYISPFI